jgi:hypothetical protein
VTLPQFFDAYPLLVVVGAFIIGVVAYLAVRIVLSSASCLVHLGCAALVVIAILLLLAVLLSRTTI